MRGRSVGRCRVCLGPGIIYPVPSLVPIPTVFAINSSILAGAGLTSSTSGASGRARVSPAGWSCLRQWRRAAGAAARRSRMRPRGGCDSRPASPKPTLPLSPYPSIPQATCGPMQQVFLPVWSVLPQHHPCATGSNPVPGEPSRRGTCLQLACCPGSATTVPRLCNGPGGIRAWEVVVRESQWAGPKVSELPSGCDTLSSHPGVRRAPVPHLSSCGHRAPGGSRRSRYSGSCRGC